MPPVEDQAIDRAQLRVAHARERAELEAARSSLAQEREAQAHEAAQATNGQERARRWREARTHARAAQLHVEAVKAQERAIELTLDHIEHLMARRRRRGVPPL